MRIDDSQAQAGRLQGLVRRQMAVIGRLCKMYIHDCSAQLALVATRVLATYRSRNPVFDNRTDRLVLILLKCPLVFGEASRYYAMYVGPFVKRISAAFLNQ